MSFAKPALPPRASETTLPTTTKQSDNHLQPSPSGKTKTVFPLRSPLTLTVFKRKSTSRNCQKLKSIALLPNSKPTVPKLLNKSSFESARLIYFTSISYLFLLILTHQNPFPIFLYHFSSPKEHIQISIK